MIPLTHYSPQQIASVISKSVIGQDEAIKVVATALSAHISRCMCIQRGERAPAKDNLMILGPTGTGKTESIRTVIRDLKLPIPIAVVAVNSLSTAGYKGKNVSDVLWDLANDAKSLLNANPSSYACPDDLVEVVNDYGLKVKKVSAAKTRKILTEMCNCGIVILDEFDKIRASGINANADFFQRQMQFELLKIVEGTTGLSDNFFIQSIDTANVLFVCIGAFTDLLNPPPARASVGFATISILETSQDNNYVPTMSQICDYGCVPELIGRIPLRCRYNALSVDDLYKILKTSQISPIKDFQTLFREAGNDLVFDDSAMRAIAKQAYDAGGGARGLRTVMSTLLYPILYDVDGTYKQQAVVITKDTVCGAAPIIAPISDQEAILMGIRKRPHIEL